MTWEDRLELWLKEDGAYRKDNLPPRQIRASELLTGFGRSPQIPLARGDQTEVPTEPDTIPIDRSPVAEKREV